MRTLTSLNGWWGFFFKVNIRILPFIIILVAIFVTQRYAAILFFVEQRAMVKMPERVKQLYGHVLPIHLKRASLRSDSYLD